MVQPECESPAAKEQQRLSSPPGKVCIILHCWPKYWETYEFDFYIVDPTNIASNDEYADIKPTIRFKASKSDSNTAAFCALNSTLYMFEGDAPRRYCDDSGRIKRAGTFAGKFETTPQILAGSDHEIERKDLDIIKPMHHNKISPIAVPTPDGKGILVFSSKFYCEGAGRYDHTFELYNVAHNSWTLLPRLKCPRNVLDFQAEAYGFETESRFAIHSKNVKVVLNLQTMCWEPPSFRPEYSRPSLQGYLLGIDGFYFTPFNAYDATDLREFQFDPCPLSQFPDIDPSYDVYHDDDRECDYYLNHRSGIPPLALLGHECDGVYDIGVVQAKRPPKSEWPSKSYKFRVILDMFRINFEEFRRDKYSIYKKDMEKFKEKEKVKLKGQSMRIDEETSDDEETSIWPEETSIWPEETCTWGWDVADEVTSIQPVSPLPLLDEETYIRPISPLLDQETSIQPVIPLLDTTITKTVKLMIDFDFDTYTSGHMYLFSI